MIDLNQLSYLKNDIKVDNSWGINHGSWALDKS